MNFDFKSLLIGFLFATSIFMYMDKNKPGRYQVGAGEDFVATIDTYTGKIVNFQYLPYALSGGHYDEDHKTMQKWIEDNQKDLKRGSGK